MNLPIQKGLQNKKPNFFIGKNILWIETYGDDIGMGDFKIHHYKKNDENEIIFYDKDSDRYCTLEYAKTYMLADKILKGTYATNNKD